LIFSLSLPGSDFIDNPGVPLNKKAGRVVKLRQILKIVDQEDTFFFKHPGNIKVSTDGNIFVRDKKQLLMFDNNGTFLKNFYKEGQGPGEVTNISNYTLAGDRIILHDSGQNKIVAFNTKNGEKVTEFRFMRSKYSLVTFQYYFEHAYYFSKWLPIDTRGKLEIIDGKASIIRVWEQGEKWQPAFSFSLKQMVLRSGDRVFSGGRCPILISQWGNGAIYLSHTPGYEIKLYDLKSHKIIKRFTRKYKRIKVTEESKKYAPGGNFGEISIDGSQWYSVPVPEYHLDIQMLLQINGKLWVVTSTVEKDNNVLVDVFSPDGIYEDNFYLTCPPNIVPLQAKKWIKGTDGKHLFLVEEDENGQLFIKKSLVEDAFLFTPNS
jgi:hypothetical protein